MPSLPQLKDLNRQLVAQERVTYTENFKEFFKAAWHESIEPHITFDDSPHYDLLFEYAQLIGSGEFKKRFPDKDGLIINIPPRSLKSMIFNVALPVWIWSHSPYKRIMAISFAMELATTFSMKRRDIIRSKWFQAHWPELKIKEDSDTKGKYDNDQTGYMLCGSPGSVPTGYGGNLIIIDDLLHPMHAFSKTTRESANRFFDSSLTSRRNNPAQDVYLIVCQRLHESDIVGHLLKQNPDRWLVVDIPLIAEETRTYIMPVSDRKWVRKKGHKLLPKRFTKQFCEDQQKLPRVWSGQYQQHPSPPGGFVFDPDRWGASAGENCYWDPTGSLPDPEFQLMSVDCTWKSSNENDYTAIFVLGISGNRRWILDFKVERMNYNQQLANIREMRSKYPKISYILIEEAANGFAVIKQLNEEMTGIIPVKPEGGKESRAVAASADMENTFWPDPTKDPRVQAHIDNFANFTGEGSIEHDDDIDAYTQAINWLRMRFWGTDHLDKAYAETLRKPGAIQKIEGKEICPGCQNPTLVREPNGWHCSNCPSQGSGSRQRIVRSGM